MSSNWSRRYAATSVRSGSYKLPVCLGNPGIQFTGRSLHSVTSKVMAEDDLVHFGFDTWGITETSTAWRGKLVLLWLRVEIGSGGVDIGIMEMPGQDELDSHIFFPTRPQEGGILSAHDAKYVIVRVAQRQHGGTTLRLAGNWGITSLHSAITFRDALATIGGDHIDLPLGFSESLME